MKSFLRIFPYFLVFVIVFLLQIKWDAENRVLPFLEPYGRETSIGTATPNRPAQVLGDQRYAWLSEQELIIATIDPAKQTSELEKRPVPSPDIYTTTTFRYSGNDLYWVGAKRVLKHAAWENGAWGAVTSFDPDVISMELLDLGEQSYILVGTETGLKIYAATGNELSTVQSFPLKRTVYVDASVDQKGIAHIGATEQVGAESYNLLYFTFDGATQKASEFKTVKELSVGTSNLVDETVFGIDETHGYYLMTYKSSRKSTTELRAVSFALADPSPKTAKDMKLIPKTMLGENAANSNSPYVRPVQEKGLQFAFVADYGKNPRNVGKEVFFSTLQNGEWKQDLERVSNTNNMGSNPVFEKQGDSTTTVFLVFAKLKTYDVLYNSNDPSYAAATNHLDRDDYTRAAMVVPQYLGMSVMLLVIAFAWPMLPFAYLFYFVVKKEDALYDQPNRHLFVSVLLYLVTQIVLFLEYGKLDSLYTYMPEWMQSGFAVSVLFVALAALSYLFTALYARTRYERSAMGEFSYFLGINVWTAMLVLSYYLAG
ncbi:hypothetical protein CIG75_12595 [Tumebacillus algifaecis]|uniref:Uncharacterized protein n=1 Tax=Tumebacillus algifaecis TaxID=1214604 RepID=A0A223D205_9BACL|nr:hypothetical protein [Tumebacillus algifaecis]ASS75739.1 hypothetical protein CIG75_12595 [Tumebacillus algifaecis]